MSWAPEYPEALRSYRSFYPIFGFEIFQTVPNSSIWHGNFPDRERREA